MSLDFLHYPSNIRTYVYIVCTIVCRTYDVVHYFIVFYSINLFTGE